MTKRVLIQKEVEKVIIKSVNKGKGKTTLSFWLYHTAIKGDEIKTYWCTLTLTTLRNIFHIRPQNDGYAPTPLTKWEVDKALY